MNEVSAIGLDLAKNVFYVHGADQTGKKLFSKKLTRSKVLDFFANTKPCLVGMEAGNGSNYWARELKKLGHDARLMAPQFVKPYVKSNKTDENDAAAICEAVTRPSMRFVGIKTLQHQDMQSIHRIRERLVASRTGLVCEIRGFLGEYGIVLPVGIRHVKNELPGLIADEENDLTPFSRELLQNLYSELLELNAKVSKYDSYIRYIHRHHPVANKLATIPGIGMLTATAIVAKVPDPHSFKNGREFAAYLGLVPKQRSSGGKSNMLGISKRGDRYIRTMLIHGARVLVSNTTKMEHNMPTKMKWLQKVKERRGYCKASVAMANKNARICWAVMTKGEEYKPAYDF